MPESEESRRILRRATSSLAEIVAVEMDPGYTAHRSTCPDGQFWLQVRGEQVIAREGGNRRQRPFDLAYYAPGEPAERCADSSGLAYGVRIFFSRLNAEEGAPTWTSQPGWQTRRQILELVASNLDDPHHLDEQVVTWLGISNPRHESRHARWISRVEELLHDDPQQTLLTLSRSVGIVPAYLSAEFSRTRGMTISSYRRQIMLQRVLQSAGHGTLNESAIEAGFYDASHFHRACVAELNVKPSALRRLIWPT